MSPLVGPWIASSSLGVATVHAPGALARTVLPQVVSITLYSMAGKVKVLATLQVAFFAWKWLVSWWSVVSNSWQLTKGLADGDGVDVLYAAPLTVLIMGLIMTNLHGFLAW